VGWMTGFELNRIHQHINKIKDLARQIAAKLGKKSANLQPDATRIPTLTAHLPRETRGINHEHSSGPPRSSQPHHPEGPH
jgi:hypothetical protein